MLLLLVQLLQKRNDDVEIFGGLNKKRDGKNELGDKERFSSALISRFPISPTNGNSILTSDF